ncbi:MAG TPA: hypothetical protein VII92_20840 [Anaerolineae bacterium]
MDALTVKTIEMTRQIREQQYAQIAGKSPADRLAFYREQAQQMDARIPALLHKVPASTDHPPEKVATGA